MKKGLKITLFVLGVILLLFTGLYASYYFITASAKLDEEKLVDTERIIEFYDKDGELFYTSSSGREVTKIEELPSYAFNAFVAIEDRRFYEHKGVDARSMMRALLTNIKSFSFKEGGSTISQQLVKNTQLTGDKTIRRKLIEIKLSRELEKRFSKEEILEKYLNTIYFGNGCYGIVKASEYYFGKAPKDLSVKESAMLASLIKSPSNYAPNEHPDKCEERTEIVLKKMLEQNFITNKQYETALKEEPTIVENERSGGIDFIGIVKSKTDEILKNYPYSHKTLRVYTGYDQKLQETLERRFDQDGLNVDKTVVIENKEGLIAAYLSTIGETARRLGSVIKPILVYAPAIETDTVFPCSLLKDEKTDFNGYSPKNYGDRYYGDVSVRFSLAKSLNVCAVKILNDVGINKSKQYAVSCGINLTENDNDLSIALGNTEKGTTLISAVGAYSVLRDNGNYIVPNVIKEITDENGTTVFRGNSIEKKVFSKATTELITEMLTYTVKNGTGKALYNGIPIAAKTGTVGNENGNTDAYTLSYNPEYTIGVWYGNDDSAYMSNSITGGSNPARLCSAIWKDIYKDEIAPNFPERTETTTALIDKEEYKKGKIVLADENAPKRLSIEEIFKKTCLPSVRSDDFSNPKVLEHEISVKYNGISIRLCLTKYAEALIYREYDGKKELIFDTKNQNRKDLFFDKDLKRGKEYIYSVIPYYDGENERFFGATFTFDKIKSSGNTPDEWWNLG